MSIRGGNCVTVRVCTDERLQIIWSSVILALKEEGQIIQLPHLAATKNVCTYGHVKTYGCLNYTLKSGETSHNTFGVENIQNYSYSSLERQLVATSLSDA